jgi:hypothetical protein
VAGGSVLKTDFDVPDTIRCPHCGGRLMLEVDEWLEDGEPTEIGCHVSCVNETEAWDDPHWQMPYVTLLPLEKEVYAWARKHVRVTETEEELRERVRAFEQGEPMPGGMRQ